MTLTEALPNFSGGIIITTAKESPMPTSDDARVVKKGRDLTERDRDLTKLREEPKPSKVVAKGRDFTEIQEQLKRSDDVGKPLQPAPPLPGAAPVMVGRVGIQSNPPILDQQIQSGWHFKQSNRHDSWFNVATNPSGGFWILTPAFRKTGEYGDATLGTETTAVVTGPRTIEFDVLWPGGGSGHYTCELSEDNQTLRGHTYDNHNPHLGGDFVGSRMPLTTTRPGKHVPTSHPRMPFIGLTWVPTTLDNNINVTVGGSGFVPGEIVHVEGRVESTPVASEWAEYAQATANELGMFTAETFAIVKPPGTQYAFRGRGERSGYTSVVGV